MTTFLFFLLVVHTADDCRSAVSIGIYAHLLREHIFSFLSQLLLLLDLVVFFAQNLVLFGKLLYVLRELSNFLAQLHLFVFYLGVFELEYLSFLAKLACKIAFLSQLLLQFINLFEGLLHLDKTIVGDGKNLVVLGNADEVVSLEHLREGSTTVGGTSVRGLPRLELFKQVISDLKLLFLFANCIL